MTIDWNALPHTALARGVAHGGTLLFHWTDAG